MKGGFKSTGVRLGENGTLLVDHVADSEGTAALATLDNLNERAEKERAAREEQPRRGP